MYEQNEVFKKMMNSNEILAVIFLLTSLTVVIIIMMGFSLNKIQKSMENMNANLTKIANKINKKRG